MYTDIYDGNVWRTFFDQVENGPFFADEKLAYHIGLAISLDWFQPYSNSQYSIDAIYGAICNLPKEDRFKPHNMLILGILPGPNEVKLHYINNYLAPIVDELIELWKGIEISTTFERPNGRKIRGALILCSCDIPAARKLMGHAGPGNKCHHCLKKAIWDTRLNKSHYGGFQNMDNWFHDADQTKHREAAEGWKRCTNEAERIRHVKHTGVRWSELLRLPYLDPIRFLVVDPMHNLFLGIVKTVVKDLWIKNNIISKTQLISIQHHMDKIRPPSDIGRLPRKVALGEKGFSSFKADEWKTFILVYATTCLWNFLDFNDRTILVNLVTACRLLVTQILKKSDLEKAQECLLTLAKTIESKYEAHSITPNLHLSLHIKQCCEDYGPLYAFWCYSYERMNGLLGKKASKIINCNN